MSFDTPSPDTPSPLQIAPSAGDRAIDCHLRGKPGRHVLGGSETLRAFYLHTPEGFGRSTMAARAERLHGVEATAGTWRTVMTQWKWRRRGIEPRRKEILANSGLPRHC
jgi:hypothetical protein